jgi:hypothetical protein
MASVDVSVDYKKVQDKIKANKSYNSLKGDYDKLTKKVGDSFEQNKSDVTTSLNDVKKQVNRYQREVKNQFSQLLDINNLSSPYGSNTINYLKKQLIRTLKNCEPQIKELLLEESFNMVGCNQDQEYTPQDIYIKVKSVDIGKILLNYSPLEKPGKILYEREPASAPQLYPFSMNRELWNRIQSSSSYFGDYGTYYKGSSGQDLFDIQYVETNAIGETGPYFKVSLQDRNLSINKVKEFMVDYYQSIKIFDFNVTMAQIMNSLSGAVSIKADIGIVEVTDQKKFEKILQRILGLCFDNKQQIDVSGIAKIGELDNIDESFFEFTDLDLRTIEQEVENVKKGVVEYLDCTEVKLPVDASSIIDSLDQLNFIPDDDLVEASSNITDSLINNPEWTKIGLRGDIQASVNLNFIQLISQGLVSGMMVPKILLPIMIMLKSIGNNIDDKINSLMDFLREFKSRAIDFISKVGAIFVKELFNIIKKDIKNLIQQIILDLAKEKADKRIIMILKLIQLLIVVAQFIRDWRECKSVVDELLSLLQIATTGWGGEIPLPLALASRLLDGYSATRAFIGTIEELQKLGIPTGPMPDGSPNLTVLSMLGQMKAMSVEEAENGKVQIAIGPLAITPAGLTVPSSAFGKKI